MLTLLLACSDPAPTTFTTLHHGGAPTTPSTSVSLDSDGACARGVDGTITCWRHDGEALAASPPTGSFDQVAGGALGGCALAGGQPSCWGAVPPPTGGPFTHVVVGDGAACGLQSDGGVSCSGPLSDVPSVSGVVSLFSDASRVCANGADAFTCWGKELRIGRVPYDRGALSPLGVCGVKSDASLRCDIDLVGGTPDLDEVVEVALNDHALCAILSAGRAHCFGRDRGAGMPPAQAVSGLVARGDTFCALDRASRKPTCWGAGYAQHVPNAGVLDMAVAGPWGCALVRGGDLACFGVLPDGLPLMRKGPFRGVSAETFNGCAARGDRTADCWGNARLVGDGPPEGATWAMVDAGHGFSCGVDAKGEVDCWGAQAPPVVPAPAGPWQIVSAGARQVCAVGRGRLACWGPGALAVPVGDTWTDVSVGRGATCARREDGTVACWGRGRHVATPEGRFSEVAAGDRVHCGLRSDDGAMTCWGAPDGPPPSGRYVDLAVASEDDAREGALVCGRTAQAAMECNWL